MYVGRSRGGDGRLDGMYVWMCVVEMDTKSRVSQRKAYIHVVDG